MSQQPPWDPYGQQPPYTPRQRHCWRRSLPRPPKILTALGVIAAFATAGCTAQHAAPAGATSSAAPSTAHSSPAAKPAVATFTGSGTRTTRRFTVTATWQLAYSFNCSAGRLGKFQVFEDGGSHLNGVMVNDLSASFNASARAHDDGGSHYLKIKSECTWEVKVFDEP
jgi:hypothetical protein